MAQIRKGEVKQKLYDMFKGRLETDIVDMVYAGCSYKVEEAISALSNMCHVPENSTVQPGKAIPQIIQPTKTLHEGKQQRSRTTRRTMYLLRGLPGSGKTYLARKLKKPRDIIISTDDYFRVGTGYRFDFTGDKLQQAHDWNLARARAAAQQDGDHNIFIDNTNTQTWEMLPYVSLAKQYDYNIRILMPNSPWAWNIDELERRNTHGVPKKTITKMLQRFERNVTVDKLLKQAQSLSIKSDSNELTEPMEVIEKDKAVEPSAVDDQHTWQADRTSAIIADGDYTNSNEKPIQMICGEDVSDKLDEEVASKLDSSHDSGVRSSYDVINDAADEEIRAALAGVNSQQGREDPPTFVNREDLKFLEECFPNYDREILESVYLKFNGDMQRICNGIMEQPLVRMTSLDGLEIDSGNFDDVVAKSNDRESYSARNADGIETESESQASKYCGTASTARCNKDNETFVLKLDRGFISAIKNYSGAAFPLSLDEVREEDTVLPISSHIAEEIFHNWEDYYKAKRKGTTEESWTEKRRKKTGSGNARTTVPRNATISSPKHSVRKETVSKPVGSSLTSSSNSPKEIKGKLQGSFRPWSAVASAPPKEIQVQEPEQPRYDLNRENPEIRLYTMFPSVKKDTLDEILVAMSNDVESAAEAVRTSLMLMPKEVEKNDLAQEKQVQVPSTKNNIDATHVRQSSADLHSESPQRSSKQTANNAVTLVDLTDSSLPGYQSLSGTSYADFRAEAQAHAAIRKEWLQKATKAYTEKHGHAASYCAEQARKQGVLMKEANKRAAGLIFLNKNSQRGDLVSFDLHGLHCEEAVEMLEEILEQAVKYRLKYIDIITGRGAHSKGKVAKLKSSVLNYLIQLQYRYAKLNDGCFRVHLR